MRRGRCQRTFRLAEALLPCAIKATYGVPMTVVGTRITRVEDRRLLVGPERTSTTYASQS